MRKKLGRVSYSIFSVHHFSLGSWLFKFCLLKEQSPNFFFFPLSLLICMKLLKAPQLLCITLAVLYQVSQPLTPCHLRLRKGSKEKSEVFTFGLILIHFPSFKVYGNSRLECLRSLLCLRMHVYFLFHFVYISPTFLTLQQKHCLDENHTNITRRNFEDLYI